MKERVFKIISNVMEVPIEDVNEESSPETIKTWDSLKQMNLILALEQEFNVQFTDEHIVDLLSVQIILITLDEIKQ